MTRIVLADDVDLVLVGLQTVLQRSPDNEIVGTYHSREELLKGLTKAAADVVIVSDRIDPECGTLSLIAQVQAVAPKSKLVLLGGQMDGLIVQEMFARGIHAYLYRSDPLSQSLMLAIRAVCHGKPFLSETASAEHMLAVQAGRQRWKLDSEALTILRLLAEGNHTSAIARKMGLKIGRVYWVRHKLRQRFGVENNEAMIARATAEGILP